MQDAGIKLFGTGYPEWGGDFAPIAETGHEQLNMGHGTCTWDMGHEHGTWPVLLVFSSSSWPVLAHNNIKT